MATGEKFTEKSSLLKALGDLVFFNRKNQTKSDNIQKALKHLAETFWAPEDGKQYARKDGDWAEVSGGDTLDVYSQEEFLSALNNTEVERINIAKSFTLTGLSYGQTVIDLQNVSKSIYGLPLNFGSDSSIWLETQGSADVKVYSDINVLGSSSGAALCEKPYTLRGDVNLFFRNIFNDKFFLAGQNSIYESAKDQNGVEDEPAGSPSPQGFWDNTFRDNQSSGGCTVESFSDQVGTSRVELTRTVCGDDVTIVGEITQSFYDGNSGYPSIKVIPRGLNYRKWFRVSEIVTINESQISWNFNSNGNQVAGLGFLFIDQLSSTVDGPSNLSLDATDVGVQRYYNTFTSSQIEDGEGLMAYDSNSPCDLISNDGLTIGYKNQEQLGRGSSADNIIVSFSIKGTLYGSDV